MGKQTFDRIRKTVAILLAVCFLVSLTAASASACKDKVVAAAPVAAAVADDANDRLGEELLDSFDDWVWRQLGWRRLGWRRLGLETTGMLETTGLAVEDTVADAVAVAVVAAAAMVAAVAADAVTA